MTEGEKLNDVQLLSRTIKRLERMGEHTIEGQLLALAKEIEHHRQHIEWYRNYIDGFPQAKPRQIVAVKVKKKAAPGRRNRRRL